MKRATAAIAVMLAIILVGPLSGPTVRAAEPGDLLGVVRRYADTMLDKGRDVYGPQKSGLLLSALDRQSLQPLTTCPAPPAGVRDIDRVGEERGPLVGANPFHDENLLRILYALSQITGEARYSEAADAEIRWFFSNTAWPQTGLLPWGEHMSWQVIKDQRASRCRPPRHEMGRPWMLWDRSFELAPEACGHFATSLWEHQIADHETGDFDRHASPHEHKPGRDYDLPRHAGMYILTWAKAYRHRHDEACLHYIDVLLAHYERKRDPATGLLPAWRNGDVAWPLSTMSTAIECYSAAADVPAPLSDRLRAFGAAEDKAFCSLDHDPAGRGFVVSAVRQTGRASGQIGRDKVQERTVIWGGTGGEATTAMVSLMCAARNRQVPSDAYRRLILAGAGAYLDRRADAGHDTWPLAVAQAISLEVEGYRLSGDRRFLDWARQLATEAVRIYWQDSPLPRASVRTDHYESLTGGDSLALALLEVATIDTPAAAQVPVGIIDR
jgi:hypothetical protein